MDRKNPKIITITNIKGGVGKSTSSIIFATLLAQKYKVLLIDMDTQASVTSYYFNAIIGQNISIPNINIHEVLIEKIDINNSIVNINSNLDIIPSYMSLYSLNEKYECVNCNRTFALGDLKLKKQISYLKGIYDYIVIDTNPCLGFTLRLALISTDYIIVPMTAERWTIESFDLLSAYINKYNLKLPIFLIVTRFKHNLTHKELLKQLEIMPNFLGIVSEREDLNRRIAESSNFDLGKDYICEYQNAMNVFLSKVEF
ncbi:ParA family protein [Borrelia turicatae]|uniref:ParA family protein n=1 Tax=Borrelia turicatae TaxID=142 RepID=UPI001FF13AC5|nr:ParA family protein [Borrelia turicatae]UPA13879.1 ParA family protein [Borrelia turicatae 91E135]UPA15369.1 ParA family protein [Borrelia turicatae]